MTNPTSPNNWITQMDKQLRRGKHVLLYGNIHDRYRSRSRYDRLEKTLDHYFLDCGYSGIVHFNIAENAHVEPTDFRLPKSLDSLDTLNCTAEICNILAEQEESPVAAVFEFADRLYSSPQQQNEQERKLLVLLQKTLPKTRRINPEVLIRNLVQARDHALENASKPPIRLPQELGGRQNAMIFIASSLQSVPAWFYQDHPAIEPVRIPCPENSEREEFFRQFMNRFIAPEVQCDEREKEKIVRAFVENTDGLMVSDMISISATAQNESRLARNAREIKELIFYYRYGDTEDPWESFNQEKIRCAFDEITRRVIGQDEAVRSIVNMLKLANVGVSMSQSSSYAGGKPKGIFFFVGPTGVGKTELAKSLAELIFGDENRMRRFDMSEYSESHAAEKLTGSPPGYVGYEEGGQLTNYVRENPFSILLFDEIEKANGKVMDKFLQILEDGRLTDGKGSTVYLSQSIIIFTSNIGSETLSNKTNLNQISDSAPSYQQIWDHYFSEVQNHFVSKLGRPEIFNRLGNNILVFDILRPTHIRGIFAKFMRNLERSALAKQYTLAYETSDGTQTPKAEESALCRWIMELMKKGDNLLYGGRRIRVRMEEKIEQPLAGWIFDHAPSEGSTLFLGINDGKLTVRGLN
ncbi:MAG: AAA family ATPase [Planctomycetia bacterium]|nr:AAA family ATPase [Planctomycetia bacterium]